MPQRLCTSLILGFALLFGGNASRAMTTITSSALDSIVIFPNDRPTLVAIDTDMQFVAIGYAADNQPVTGMTFAWSTGGNIGRITTPGIFTGERGGIGTITATSGNVSASVGVVVKGRASDLDLKKKPQPTVLGASTSQTGQSRLSAKDQPSTDKTTNSNLNTNTSETAGSPENQQSKSSACTPWPTIAWIGMILVFTVLFIVYFLLLGDSTSLWWWAPPVVLLALLLVLYSGVRCGSSQIWVPIVLLVVGAGIAFLYYQLLRPRGNTIYVPPQR